MCRPRSAGLAAGWHKTWYWAAHDLLPRTTGLAAGWRGTIHRIAQDGFLSWAGGVVLAEIDLRMKKTIIVAALSGLACTAYSQDAFSQGTSPLSPPARQGNV